MKHGFSWDKAERLRRTVDFQRVYSRGKCFRGDDFRFYVLARSPGSLWKKDGRNNPERTDVKGSRNRIGFVVSKRVGKAVTRNRVRRLLREVYRLNRQGLKEGQDLVVVANKGADALGFLETQEALQQLFKKAGLNTK